MRDAQAIAAVFTWLGLTGLGFMLMFGFSASPAPAATTVTALPADSAIVLDSDRPTLVVFIHPKCGCTRATLAELERIIGRTEGGIDVRIVVVLPKGSPSEWRETKLVQQAQRVAGAMVTFDGDGVEAARLGVKTSGHALMFDQTGRVCFSGGITPARGHEGDSTGKAAVMALARNETAACSSSSVFGCSLITQD